MFGTFSHMFLVSVLAWMLVSFLMVVGAMFGDFLEMEFVWGSEA